MNKLNRENRPYNFLDGFTFIELLIVITILALLAAILFPVFGRARENARRSSCQNNLKQLGMGILQYSQDYDETLVRGSGAQPRGVGWAGEVFPYVKSTQVYRCPSDTGSPSGGGGAPPVSYNYNSNLACGTNWMTTGGRIAAFNAPSKTVMLCELQSNWVALLDPTEGFSRGNNGVGWNANPNVVINFNLLATGPLGGRDTAGSYYASGTGRHLEGSNFLMADGHVKWLKWFNVSSGFNAVLPTSPQEVGGAAPTYTEAYNIAPPGHSAAGTENSTYSVTFSTI